MKNRKKMVIGIIIAIIVIIVTLVTLYFTTDIFKTNKQLFYKYISKVNDNPNSFLQMYTDTNNKITKNNRSSTYELNFSMSNSNQETGNIDTQKIFSITGNGLDNTSLEQFYKDFTLSVNDQNILTIKLVKDNNTYAIGADNILAKYIAVENSNLKELFTKFGVTDVSQVPDSISNNFDELFKIDEATLNSLNQTYFKILDNNINEKNYYKTRNDDETEKIGITLTEDETVNLIKTILETAQNDNVLLNLIMNKAHLLGYNEITVQNIQYAIQEEIQSIFNDGETYSTNPDFIKFALVKKENKIIGFELETNYLQESINNNESQNNKHIIKIDFSNANKIVLSTNVNDINIGTIILTNSYDDNNLYANVEVITKNEETNQDLNILNIQYQLAGYKTNNIEQNCIINIAYENEQSAQIKYTNNIILNQDIQIERLTNENSAKLNDMTAEQINQLIIALNNRIEDLYGDLFNNLLASSISPSAGIMDNARETQKEQ